MNVEIYLIYEKNAYNKYESKLQAKMELLSKQLQDIKNDYEKKLIVAYKTTNENIARQVRSEFLKTINIANYKNFTYDEARIQNIFNQHKEKYIKDWKDNYHKFNNYSIMDENLKTNYSMDIKIRLNYFQISSKKLKKK